jgi:peptide/nickel transport system permease protein
VIRFAVRRLLTGLIALLVFEFIIFFAVQLAFPGDYASTLKFQISAEELNQLRQSLGLDQTLGHQYLIWVRSLVTGDPPLYRSMVVGVLVRFLPASLFAFGSAAVIAFFLGQRLGIAAAWRGPSLFSEGVSLLGILSYASFPPALVLLLSVILGVRERTVAYPLDPTLPFWRTSAFSPETVLATMTAILAGLVLGVSGLGWAMRRIARVSLPPFIAILSVPSLLALASHFLGFGAQALAVLKAAVLPMLAYIMIGTGEVLVIMRASMENVIHEDYVQTARAKGLPDRQIRDRHAARSALLPVVSRMVVSLPYLMAGLVMVEAATGWPGMGNALFSSVTSQFMPGVLAQFLVIGGFTLVARVGLDILLAYLDPRLQSPQAKRGLS